MTGKSFLGLGFPVLSDITAAHPLRVIALRLVTSCSPSPGDKQGAWAAVDSVFERGQRETSPPDCWAAVNLQPWRSFTNRIGFHLSGMC